MHYYSPTPSVTEQPTWTTIEDEQLSAANEDELDSPPSTQPRQQDTTRSKQRDNRRLALMRMDDASLQRYRDDRKEVERRRRENIADGIKQLEQLLPDGGDGKESKASVVARAAQYIKALEEEDAINMEKWALEKLLMDRATEDLRTRVVAMKCLWEVERRERERAEAESAALRSSRNHTAATTSEGTAHS